MAAKPKKTSKSTLNTEFSSGKKLTMRDIFKFWRKKEEEITFVEENQSVEDKSSQNTTENWITMTIIDDFGMINGWIYTINEEQVQKFFQFIKEKAFYQQLWPQIVMNKFKDIIWYDK